MINIHAIDCPAYEDISNTCTCTKDHWAKHSKLQRIGRPHMFMDMCEVAAKRSTCFRGNVGALVVHNHDLISMGYNGPPPGHDHCYGNDCPISETGGCVRSVHAESNAIVRAQSRLRKHTLIGCDLYCTYSPCPDCAQIAREVGIDTLYYRYSYRLHEGIDLLIAGGVRVLRVTTAGYVLDEVTKQIVT